MLMDIGLVGVLILLVLIMIHLNHVSFCSTTEIYYFVKFYNLSLLLLLIVSIKYRTMSTVDIL